MGAGLSKKQSNDQIVPLNKSENKPTFQLNSGDIKQMRQKIQNLVRYHSENNQIFTYLKNANIVCKNDNTSLTTLLDIVKKDKNLATKQTQVKYLYDIGAIFFDTSTNRCYLRTYNGFDTIYSSFIDNLKYLETVDVNTIQLNDKIDVDVSSFHREIQHHIKLITTRIIYYSFSIAYNNFLMSVYVMYAKKQFSVIEKTFKKIQKENQLRIVREKLNRQMKLVRAELNKMNTDSTSQLNARISELSAFFQKTQQDARKQTVLQQKGGSNISPALDALNQIHTKKLKEYTQSNKTLETFLTMINSIIKQKTNRIIAKYLNTDFNTPIVPSDLRNNINDIISKIQSLDNKNAIGLDRQYQNAVQINNIIKSNNIAADENTKNELAKYDIIIKDLLDFKEIQTNTMALQNQLLNDQNLMNQASQM
tara:strand:- start:3560 stop:4825 length:1266 start_codon:yes stop_codon:yes gene_type:complete